ELLDETLDLLELRPVLALPLGDELLGVRTVPGLVGRLDLGVDVVDDAVELLVEVLPLRQLALDRLEVHSEPSHCVLLRVAVALVLIPAGRFPCPTDDNTREPSSRGTWGELPILLPPVKGWSMLLWHSRFRSPWHGLRKRHLGDLRPAPPHEHPPSLGHEDPRQGREVRLEDHRGLSAVRCERDPGP